MGTMDIGIVQMKFWVLLLMVWTCIGCSKSEKKEEDPSVWYTCSMDPQVMERKPGKCPICKMDLTKIKVDPNRNQSVHLSEGQEKLANIRTATAENGMIASSDLLNGVIVFNEKLTYQVSARAAGRIEHVHTKSVGTIVKTTEPLYTLYSQMIVASWRELSNGANPDLPIQSENDKNNVISSIRNRLKYMGISEQVIEKMESNKMTGTDVPFYAPKGGIVSQVLVKEGDNVQAGQALFEVVDLSHVWVEANLYPMDNQVIEKGQLAKVFIEGESKSIVGYVESLKPELKENTRITILRIDIPNPGMRLKPGMKAQISIPNKKETAIKLPESAVIQSGTADLVWVKTAPHTYEPREVKLGLSDAQYIAVEQGISPEDEVVVSGAYLLNSEFVFKRKSKM